MKKNRLSRRDFLKVAAAAGVVLIGGTAQALDGSKNTAAAKFPSPEAYIPFVKNNPPPTSTPFPTTAPTTPPGGITPGPVGDIKNIVFLHRSVGEGMILGGSMRSLLTAKGYQFWDYFVSSQLLRNPSGENTNIKYNVPEPDNTEPVGLAAIFSQPHQPNPAYPSNPANAMSGLLRHQVILFKSCYTAVQYLDSDQDFEDYKAYSITVRERAKQHPDKIFIHLTPPPTSPSLSYDGNAARGRAFADWMMSSAYRAGTSNLFVYNLFDPLAVPANGGAQANLLRPEYRESDGNSHPTFNAWPIILPGLVDFIDQSIRSYS